MMSEGNRGGLVGLIVGVGLIGLGMLFLLAEVLRINLWGYIWPFFIIIPGLIFFIAMVLGGKSAAPLAIPGSLITILGLLLFYQTLFNHFESWAYAWALIFPTGVGIGLIVDGTWAGRPGTVEEGKRWAKVGIIIFLALGAFFELILGISRHGPARFIWPLLVVAAGLYLIFRQTMPGQRPATAAPARPTAEEQPAQPAGGGPEEG